MIELNTIRKSPWWPFGLVPLLLLVPLVAMQFTEEVNWTPADFLVAGLLLSGLIGAVSLVRRCVTTPRLRWVVLIAVGAAFLLLWVELAVGLFGTPLAGS